MQLAYDFFYRQGYGIYIYSAYASVFLVLFWYWLKPWIKWRNYKNKK